MESPADSSTVVDEEDDTVRCPCDSNEVYIYIVIHHICHILATQLSLYCTDRERL